MATPEIAATTLTLSPCKPVHRSPRNRRRAGRDPVSAIHRVAVGLQPQRAQLSVRRVARRARRDPPGLRLHAARRYSSACVLHDLGVGTAAARQGAVRSRGRRSRGGAADRTRLRARDVVDGVWEAIALHTSGGIAERRGALCYLVRSGVGADFGRNAEFIDERVATGDPPPIPAAGHGEHTGGRDRRARPAQPRRRATLFDAGRPAARTANRRHHPGGTHGLARPVGRLIDPIEYTRRCRSASEEASWRTCSCTARSSRRWSRPACSRAPKGSPACGRR